MTEVASGLPRPGPASGLPLPEPEPSAETQPFWDAAARGELVLSRCPECGELIWYPRAICPFCHHQGTEWVAVSGAGTIYSCSTVRRMPGPFGQATPYTVAYVQLAEGPRLLTNIVGAAPGEPAIGGAVQVVFEPTPGGAAIPRFRLVSG